MAGIDFEPPDLECLGCDIADGLSKRDFIEQPVGSGAFSDVLSAISIEHVSCDAVAMPLFRACELAEVCFCECFLRHSFLLVCVYTPLRGDGAKAEAMRLSVMPPTRER